jgi:hypothetical protein
MGLRLRKLAAFAALGAFLLLGCASKPIPIPVAVTEVKQEPRVEQKEAPPPDKPPVEEKKVEEVKVAEEPKKEVPLPEPEKKPEEKPPEVKPAEIVVSKEIYLKTFDELEARIKQWNAIIARKDFDSWNAALSQAYVAERGSAAYLAELSRNQKLRDHGVALTTLKDYFLYVVVPARVDAALDRISFVNEDKVKAYANLGGDPAILFYVVREGGVWKIGTSGE